MKVFIALALVSVAFATPLTQPITLPEAPVPAMEGAKLPMPVLPATLDLSRYHKADIRPAMVPQSVIDELKAQAVDPVKVVEIADVAIPLEVVNAQDAEITYDAVKFVDNVVEAVKDDVIDAVRFVDAAEIQADSVIVVDHPIDAEVYADGPVNVDSADVVKYAQVSEIALEGEVSDDRIVDAPIESGIEADAVRVVDGPIENEILADAVRVVDAPIEMPNMEQFLAIDAVHVVHVPVIVTYPGYHSNPLARNN